MKTPIQFLFFLILVFGFVNTNAQEGIFSVSNQSFVMIKGTSTLHGWEMKTSTVTGKATFDMQQGALSDIKNLLISSPAESLKSDKESMDKNAYKALKTDAHKTITFQLTDVKSIEKKGTAYEVGAVGNLQIAGTTKSVNFKIMCEQKGSSWVCSGEKSVDMSTFEVEPPSFMFGTVKTGDTILIEIHLQFVK